MSRSAGSFFSSLVSKKYRGILISVALFLLLDASVLLLNFFISFQIADDAVDVNLAGRQRMLSQRMTKALYALNTEYRTTGEFTQPTLDELRASQNLFNMTFYAFLDGGSVSGASNEVVDIQATLDPAAIEALLKAEALWLPYRQALNDLLAADVQSTQSALEKSLAVAATNNLNLLKLMNDLTVSLERVAKSKADRLRIIQTIGISLAIINFLFILFHFLRQLREGDAILDEARSETVEILNTVNEGLFLVDKNLIIGSQYSKALEDILSMRALGGQSLSVVLNNIVNEKEAKTTTDFIGLLFNPKVKEKLIGDLNPLHEVEVIITAEDQTPQAKFLNFNFSRAYNEGEISHVLVSVTDITERIALTKALDETKEQADKEIEMLTGLLHASPVMLQSFIANAYRFYTRINNILKSKNKSDAAIRLKLSDIFVQVHNFKGEAASLKLDNFSERAHVFEESIVELKNKPDLIPNDFLSLTVYLDELIAYTQQVEAMAKKMASYGATSVISQPAADERWNPLYELVEAIAQKNDKAIKLVCSGLDFLKVDKDFEQALKMALIQLLRNSAVHGIESKAERIAKHKDPKGRIDVRVAQVDAGVFEVVVEDDGAGFNYELIRQKAIESGRWNADEVNRWSHQQLVSAIFQEDISTARSLSKDAGRGVGMSAVLSWVNQHQGKVKVASRPDKYTRFMLTVMDDSAKQVLSA